MLFLHVPICLFSAYYMMLSMLLSVISIAWSVYIVRAWRGTPTECISKCHIIYLILCRFISPANLRYVSQTKQICHCTLTVSTSDHTHSEELDNMMTCMWHTSLDFIDKVMFIFQAVPLLAVILVFMVILPANRGYFS